MMGFTDWIKCLFNHGKALLQLREALHRASTAEAIVAEVQRNFKGPQIVSIYRLERALRKSKNGQITLTLNDWRWYESSIPDYYRLVDAELFPQYQPTVQCFASLGYVCTHPEFGWWQKPGSDWLIVYRPNIGGTSGGILECLPKMGTEERQRGKPKFWASDGQSAYPATADGIARQLCGFMNWRREYNIC